jgi:hypothetical protein
MNIEDAIFFLKYYIKFNCNENCMLAIAGNTLIKEYEEKLKTNKLEVSDGKSEK